MEPVILALEEKYDKKIVFIIVDVDDVTEGRKMIGDFGVYSIPAFFYLNKHGEIIAEDVGVKSFEHLESRILELLTQ
jgi:thiol-disulfide isomerase/thioredoxin